MEHLLCAVPWAAGSQGACPPGALGSPSEQEVDTNRGAPAGPEISTPRLLTPSPAGTPSYGAHTRGSFC